MHGCIYNDYLHKSGFGGPAGQFGYPVSNEQETTTNDGRVNYMSGSPCGSNPEPHSALYFNGATWGVKGCIFAKYRAIGETGSFLGYPMSLEYSTSQGIRQDFQYGYMLWANGVATPVRTAPCPAGFFSDGTAEQNILNAYKAAGGQPNLGCPFDNGGGIYVHYWSAPRANVQDFSGGAFGPAIMVDGPKGEFFVHTSTVATRPPAWLPSTTPTATTEEPGRTS